MSNHDTIRAAFETSMEDDRSVDLDGFKEVLAEHDVDMNVRVTKSGKNTGQTNLSYKTGDMKQFVRGARLGSHYTFDDTVDEATGEIISGVGSQLEAKASGAPRQGRPTPRQTDPPKPVPVASEEELAEAQEVMERLAAQERIDIREDRLDAWIDDLARRERTRRKVMLLHRGLDDRTPAGRGELHSMMEADLEQQEAAAAAPVPASAAVPVDVEPEDIADTTKDERPRSRPSVRLNANLPPVVTAEDILRRRQQTQEQNTAEIAAFEEKARAALETGEDIVEVTTDAERTTAPEQPESVVEPVRAAERPEEPVEAVVEPEMTEDASEDSEQALRQQQQRQVRERQQRALEQDQPDFTRPASQPEPEPAPKRKTAYQIAEEEIQRELDRRGLGGPQPEPDPVMPPPRRRRK